MMETGMGSSILCHQSMLFLVALHVDRVDRVGCTGICLPPTLTTDTGTETCKEGHGVKQVSRTTNETHDPHTAGTLITCRRKRRKRKITKQNEEMT